MRALGTSPRAPIGILQRANGIFAPTTGRNDRAARTGALGSRGVRIGPEFGSALRPRCSQTSVTKSRSLFPVVVYARPRRLAKAGASDWASLACAGRIG